jgi:sterol desaturase/sphingolipid hydroxylase (fatty acid hydroxylase superfamily)
MTPLSRRIGRSAWRYSRRSVIEDVTVLAAPVYFGTMALERLVLQRRAAGAGATAADYTREDTITSLSMGVGSILVLGQQAVLRRLVPGRTRPGTVLAGVAAAAVVATTVADRRNRRRARQRAQAIEAGGDTSPSPADVVSEQVSRLGGVTAVATGSVIVIASGQYLISPARQWEKGRGRDLGTGLAGWAVAIIGWDLLYYLNHRLLHEVRALWAMHVVHHSSERLNLSTALRQPVSAFVVMPYGALARLGVRPRLIEYARAVNLLYQYWIHTETIDGMGRAEAVLNSPSHHRVHHGSNQRYLDRNHAGIFILWDRLLGTFEPEDPAEPAVYGLTRNVDSFNVLRIATHEYVAMARDIASATTWRDRLSFVLRGPGWAYRRREELAQVRH